MIIDKQGDPLPEIYIRELLDMPSHEFQESNLGARQKMEIIQILGADALTNVLEKCFKQTSKNYDASKEAECAIRILNKVLDRGSRPAQLDPPSEADS